MRITARVESRPASHSAIVSTSGRETVLDVPSKDEGGSAVNGGELLFLALATCYCNDVYREAAAADIGIEEVHVAVEGEFGGPGDPARDVSFSVYVVSNEPEETVRRLLEHTDRVAEIQNTLRQGIDVTLGEVTIVPKR